MGVLLAAQSLQPSLPRDTDKSITYIFIKFNKDWIYLLKLIK
jgi:hypothetical protein